MLAGAEYSFYFCSQNSVYLQRLRNKTHSLLKWYFATELQENQRTFAAENIKHVNMDYISTTLNYLSGVIAEIGHLINEMSPYLLLGFLLAGFLHEFVPSTLYTKYLGERNFRSVLLSALFGVPLPLCSCGVIPTAMGLRREGASKGATVSFLIATPQTGVDSIVATYSLMGLPFAVVRPFVAFITAIFGGLLVTRFDDDEVLVARKTEPQAHGKKAEEPILHRLRNAIEYAFIEMMEDIGKWLVVGLIVAGIITAVVPDSWFTVFQDNSLYSILFVLVFAIPMYLCATGSIPIAVALMMKGLTPGAALVLLMAGPASNAASILVIRKVLGRRTLMLYLAAIVGGAVLFGLGIDHLLPREWFTATLTQKAACCEEGSGWFSILCTGLMICLLLNALSPIRLWKGRSGHCHCHGHEHGHEHGHGCECEHSCECETEEHTHYYIYKVRGMHCNHCSANAQKAIASVDGVKEVSVSLEREEARIEGTFDEEEVRRAIEDLGFKLENV